MVVFEVGVVGGEFVSIGVGIWLRGKLMRERL